uniref:Nucleoprotein n=1 Tax=Emaravirus camelliae TaxID=2843907 RepID=A0A8B0RCP7_9VIRU|nr:nucleoprotein [Emaravirus camelliae]
MSGSSGSKIVIGKNKTAIKQYDVDAKVFTESKQFSNFFEKGNVVRNTFNVDDSYYKNSNLGVVIEIYQSIKEIKLELNEQLKRSKFLKIDFPCDGNSVDKVDKNKLYVIKDPVQVNRKFLSVNQLSALVTYIVCKCSFGDTYSWELNSYKNLAVGVNKELKNHEITNRLALKIGLTQWLKSSNKINRLYYLYVTGFEHLFEFYPEEVVAICLYRATTISDINNEEEKYNSLKNLASKMIKVSNTVATNKTAIDVLNSLNKRNIVENYNELKSLKSGISEEYKDIIDKIMTLFSFN